MKNQALNNGAIVTRKVLSSLNLLLPELIKKVIQDSKEFSWWTDNHEKSKSEKLASICFMLLLYTFFYSPRIILSVILSYIIGNYAGWILAPYVFGQLSDNSENPKHFKNLQFALGMFSTFSNIWMFMQWYELPLIIICYDIKMYMSDGKPLAPTLVLSAIKKIFDFLKNNKTSINGRFSNLVMMINDIGNQKINKD